MAKKTKKEKKGRGKKDKKASGRTSIKEIVHTYAKEEFEDVSGREMYTMARGIFERIASTLTSGTSVSVPGFGMFKIMNRAARTGFNPQTKKKIEIPARKAVKFKPAKSIKEELAA